MNELDQTLPSLCCPKCRAALPEPDPQAADLRRINALNALEHMFQIEPVLLFFYPSHLALARRRN